jgi:perosamine synthetase
VIHCGEPQIGALERQYVNEVLDSGRLTEGEWCAKLARALTDVIIRPCHPVSSGTAALHLALLAVGVQPGDEVIVPALTYVATANAVLMCGAKPVVVDVDQDTWTICLGAVTRHLTRRTKAIVPVHLYGVPAATLQDVAVSHYRRTGRQVMIVEDCAEALGARAGTRSVGQDGDAAAWSFYGSKTITTGGEGGAVSYSSTIIGGRAWHLAHQGQTDQRYVHDCLAWNYRMTELQAAVGVAQMRRLWEFHAARCKVFEWYDQRLDGRFPRQGIPPNCQHGYWAYAIRLPFGSKPRLVSLAMALAGVETRPVFPPIVSHRHMPAGDCYRAGCIADSGLVLPTHCGLTEEDVDTVCKELIRAVEST